MNKLKNNFSLEAICKEKVALSRAGTCIFWIPAKCLNHLMVMVVSATALGASLGEAATGADLGGSSKYSNRCRIEPCWLEPASFRFWLNTLTIKWLRHLTGIQKMQVHGLSPAQCYLFLADCFRRKIIL